MSFLNKLESDFHEALKARCEPELSVLRMVKASLEKEEIAQKKRGKLTEEDVQKIIKREIKGRKEAIGLYEKGGRGDLAEKEKNELAVLEKYLAKQLPEEEIEKIVKEKIEELKVSGPQGMGKVMGAVMKEFQGKADGAIVNQIVKKLLNK